MPLACTSGSWFACRVSIFQTLAAMVDKTAKHRNLRFRIVYRGQADVGKLGVNRSSVPWNPVRSKIDRTVGSPDFSRRSDLGSRAPFPRTGGRALIPEVLRKFHPTDGN